MSQYQFDAIMLLFKTLGIIAGGVIVIAKWIKYLEVKALEKSVGAAKIKEMEARLAKVDQDFKVLEDAGEMYKSEITKLKKDYERLVEHIWEILSK